MVAIGLGATLAGVLGALPFLIWLSEYKVWVFIVAGVFLLLAAALQWWSASLPCPIQNTACQTLRYWSRIGLVISIFVYGTGVLFAFILPYAL